MKRVLIWDKPYVLKNTGGPAGYLFNIKKYLSLYPCENVSFYSDLLKEDFKNEDNEIKISALKLKIAKACKILPFLSELRKRYFVKQKISKREKEIISLFDYVHFHALTDYFIIKSDIPRTVGVMLTTHTPEPLYDEVCGICEISKNHIFAKLLRPLFLKYEAAAYDNADKLIFPTEDALEVYTNNSKQLAISLHRNSSKMFFIPTTLFPNHKIESKEYPISKLSLPPNAFVISYIGRHNQVKGYDFIKKLAVEVWKTSPNVFFVIGGNETPLKGIKDTRWKELGWVNTQDVLNQSDIFILPNRETYFDLIALEVLRQGVPLVATRTGGNKWFEKNGLKGVYLFDKNDTSSALTSISSLMKIKERGDLDKLKENIRSEFALNFNMKNFVERYVACLNSVK